MRLEKIGLVFWGMTVMTFLGVAMHASREKAALEARRLILINERNELHAALGQERVTHSETQAEFQSPSAKNPMKAPNAESVAAAEAEPGGAVSPVAMRANNLDLTNLWIAARSAALNQTYGPFFQALRIPPDRAERLKAIETKRIADHEDIGAVALAKGLEYKNPTIQELLRQADVKTSAAETALLGPDGFRQLEDYRRALPARSLVHGLAGFVAFADPLSAAQAEQMTRMLATASPAFNVGKDVVLEEIDWPKTDEKVRAILSPFQFAIWQQGGSQDVRGGFSRAAIQLQNAYDKAVRADQESAAMAHPDLP